MTIYAEFGAGAETKGNQGDIFWYPSPKKVLSVHAATAMELSCRHQQQGIVYLRTVTEAQNDHALTLSRG